MNTIHRTGEISGFRSEIVTVDGIRVHYWRGGDAGGQPVLTLTRMPSGLCTPIRSGTGRTSTIRVIGTPH